MSDCRGRWHLQGALWRRQQRPERQLGFAGWRLSLPDLRERLEAGRVRHQTGWLAGGGYQRRDPLQQPGGVGGILIRLHGDVMTQFSHGLARRLANEVRGCPSATRLNWVATSAPPRAAVEAAAIQSRTGDARHQAGHRLYRAQRMYYCVFTPTGQLVEADVRCNVTTRSHRRVESFSHARCEQDRPSDQGSAARGRVLSDRSEWL